MDRTQNQRNPWAARGRWMLLAAIIALLAAATRTLLDGGSPDDLVKPVRPNLARDAATTFLADLSAPKAAASGSVFTPTSLAPELAKRRTVTRSISPPGSRNSAEFTVEEETLPWSKETRPLEIRLPGLKVGLYSLHLYGSVQPAGRAKLDRVWNPCPIEFEAFGPDGRRVDRGRRLAKQGFAPRRLQGFHLHADAPGDYRVVFRLGANAKEALDLQKIVLVDALEGLPSSAIKTGQNIAPGKTGRLAELTEARKQRDDLIWNALPPANAHMQVHNQLVQFRNPPAGVKLPDWTFAAWKDVPGHSQIHHVFTPMDLVNPGSGQVALTQADLLDGKPLRDGDLADDGTGLFFRKADHPGLPHDIYVAPLADLLGRRVQLFVGLLGAWDHGGASLATKYFETGDAEAGHDAAMALVRVAYDWPALEMNLHEHRLATHSPDLEFGEDWSGEGGRTGKYFYAGWSGSMAVAFMTAYDRLFPYLRDNPVFAAAVNRHIPWIKTPRDVVAFLDRQLVFASVRDFNRGWMRAAPVTEVAGQVLGPHAETAALFDLTRSEVEIYPYRGSYEDLYATALSRSGSYHIGSFLCYAFGNAADTLTRADLMRQARGKGVKPPLDLSDANLFPKVRAAGDFLIDMFFAGGFPAMIGDASGGPHTGFSAAVRAFSAPQARDASRAAFNLSGDPRHAWLLANLHKSEDPRVVKAAANVKNPLLHGQSRVVPDYLAIVEEGRDSDDPLDKTAMTVRLGCGQGHAHSDALDLNLFGLGAPLAVDLACRSEGGNWSRPKSSSAGLHNVAIAHDTDDFHAAGAQSGEPWLRAFAPPLVRGRYESRTGAETLERDVCLVQDGGTNRFYVLDLQRLTGGKLHTWCFHGCESDGLQLNVPMASNTVRWIDRTLEGTHRTGKAADLLQAVWTMTREGREFKHTFDKGGTIKTVACEPHVLGDLYDPARPPLRVRAQLLGRGQDTVLQGNPYSQSYDYCFPFLWVQREANGGESVYPAVYDAYRGDQPVVKTVELVKKENPLTVKVATHGGQTDLFTLAGDVFTAVSRDAQGLRWARLSGGKELKDGDLEIQAKLAKYVTAVAAMDYDQRTLATREPLPPNPRVTIGSAGNRRSLHLQGRGTQFTFRDDLVIQEGVIRKVDIKGEDEVAIESEPRVFHADNGNRKMAGFTVVLKGTEWQFRGGKVIRRPAGAALTPTVFAHPSGQGYGKTRIYEIGAGDTVELLADVDLRRADVGYKITANVEGEATIHGRKIAFRPGP